MQRSFYEAPGRVLRFPLLVLGSFLAVALCVRVSAQSGWVESRHIAQPHPTLVKKWQARLAERGIRLKREAVQNRTIPLAITPPLAGSMPLASTGTVKTLTLLVEFADVPSRISRDAIDRAIYGDGNGGFPFESLAAYYRRSSYGKLNFTGTTLGWYRLKGTRAYYESLPGDQAALQAMVAETLDYYRSAGGGSLNFATFDTDGDGYLDAINVIHSGSSTRGSTQFDGYMSTFADAGYTVDGKKLGPFIFLWENADSSISDSASFGTRVLIHETGHLLGLPDYYDYYPFVDDGIVGGIFNDIMGGGTEGDHNVFSKWLLGWVSPFVISSGLATYSLNAASGPSDSNTAFAIFPGLSGTSGNLFSQFFMIENAQRTGNRSPNVNSSFASGISDGLVIWHIDATLNSDGSNVLYNNTAGPRKLMRMMQADGQDDIETVGTLGVRNILYPADASDFWQAGDAFSTNTMPNSGSYEGQATGVVVKDISPVGPVMNVTMGIENPTRQAPVMLGPSSATGLVNSLFRFPIRALGGPVLFSSGPLPDGLSIEPIAGAVVGVPTTPGTYVVALSAANELGSASLNVSIQILGQAPPPEMAPNYQGYGELTASAAVNSMFQFALTATNAPTRYRIYASLPAGLRLDPETGNISGIPTSAGVYDVPFAAYNNSGVGWGHVLISVSGQSLAALSVVKTHSGNFTQGQSNAVYTVTASNQAGAGPTSSTVTVTETVPAGLTLVSMAGTGWMCPPGANTCARSDALAAGASYPAISVTTHVGQDATSPQVNRVTISGGGAPIASWLDSTNISLGCSCSLNFGGQAHTAAGGSGSVNVITTSGCSWTASSDVSWVLLTGDTSGTGAGTLNFFVQANTGTARSGTLTIGSQTLTIQQARDSTTGLTLAGTMPQIASAGGWDTSLTLVNLGTTSGEALLSLYADDGSMPKLPFTFPQQPLKGTVLGSTFDESLAANASLVLDTTGPPTQVSVAGSAQLLTSGNVGGFGIFQIQATGQQAVVPLETRNAPSYLLAFDSTSGLQTGLALANVSATEGDVKVIVRDDTGAVIPTAVGSIHLDGGGHKSFMLNDGVQGFPEIASKRGTIEFDTPSGGRVSVLGIRANGKSITTLPVLAQVGTIGGALAHVATGGGWETLFTLVNTGTSSASLTLSFYDEKTGAPLPLSLGFPQGDAPQTTASATHTLAPGASLWIQTQGGSATVTCSARLVTTGNVSGFAIFQVQGSGQEAVVPLETRTPSAFVLAYDNVNGLATGVALANLTANLTIVDAVVRDDTGATLTTGHIQLPANGHESFMLTDATQGFPVTAGKRGTVEFQTPSGGRISVLGIRAVTPTNVITTIPVMAK